MVRAIYPPPNINQKAAWAKVQKFSLWLWPRARSLLRLASRTCLPLLLPGNTGAARGQTHCTGPNTRAVPRAVPRAEFYSPREAGRTGSIRWGSTGRPSSASIRCASSSAVQNCDGGGGGGDGGGGGGGRVVLGDVGAAVLAGLLLGTLFDRHRRPPQARTPTCWRLAPAARRDWLSRTSHTSRGGRRWRRCTSGRATSLLPRPAAEEVGESGRRGGGPGRLADPTRRYQTVVGEGTRRAGPRRLHRPQ
jgi:hypothetical protein